MMGIGLCNKSIEENSITIELIPVLIENPILALEGSKVNNSSSNPLKLFVQITFITTLMITNIFQQNPRVTNVSENCGR